LAIGVYPTIGLKDAREAREGAKRLLADGQDPALAKKQAKAAKVAASANTFAALTEEFLAKKRREGKAENTLGKLDWLLGLAMDDLGARPISEITSPEVLAVLRRVEARGQLETAGRLRANIGGVFRYAIATGKAENDPTFALRGALTVPKTKHRAAIVEPVAFGALLRSIDDYEGTPEVRAALKLMALTFVRPGELRNACWSEFDLEAGLWVIPAGRMKMRRAHRVPLAPQTVAILKELHAITGHRTLLFPGVRSAERAMSENTINAALRRLGYGKDDMTGHGFRYTTARDTICLSNCAIKGRRTTHLGASGTSIGSESASLRGRPSRFLAQEIDRIDGLYRSFLKFGGRGNSVSAAKSFPKIIAANAVNEQSLRPVSSAALAHVF
jgi:integrase